MKPDIFILYLKKPGPASHSWEDENGTSAIHTRQSNAGNVSKASRPFSRNSYGEQRKNTSQEFRHG
jgi:hypothetical protein